MRATSNSCRSTGAPAPDQQAQHQCQVRGAERAMSTGDLRRRLQPGAVIAEQSLHRRAAADHAATNCLGRSHAHECQGCLPVCGGSTNMPAASASASVRAVSAAPPPTMAAPESSHSRTSAEERVHPALFTSAALQARRAPVKRTECTRVTGSAVAGELLGGACTGTLTGSTKARLKRLSCPQRRTSRRMEPMQ